MLPSNYNSDIETSGGDINLGKLKGKTELNTSGGDITLNTMKVRFMPKHPAEILK
jgi:hypothetical protein